MAKLIPRKHDRISYKYFSKSKEQILLLNKFVVHANFSFYN